NDEEDYMSMDTENDEEAEFEEESLEDCIYRYIDFSCLDYSGIEDSDYGFRQYEEPLLSGDSEIDYWQEKVPSSSFSNNEDLLTFVEEQILLKRNISLARSCTYFAYFINSIVEQSDVPIIDLLNSYYENEVVNVKYNIGELPLDLMTRFKEFLQKNRANFA
ncbi:6587_t:CDS:2, partial [Gigaspora rosea]